MNGKIARIQDLLDAGWAIEDIQSDDEHVEVLLARDTARRVVGLDRQDAWDVLFGEPFELRAGPAREQPVLH